jgi:hypothetical protein
MDGRGLEMASVEMKVHRTPVVPAILAVLAGAAGLVVGATVAIIAWQGPGGGCFESVGAGWLEPFTPSACNVALQAGMVLGTIVGVGSVLWGTSLHRRGRSSAFSALAGLATAIAAAAGLYGGIQVGANWLQRNGLHGDPTALWLFAIGGVALGPVLVGIVTSMVGRRTPAVSPTGS